MLRPDQPRWGDGLWAHESSQAVEAAPGPRNVGLAPWPRGSTGVSSALQQKKQCTDSPCSAPQPRSSTTFFPRGRSMGLTAPRHSLPGLVLPVPPAPATGSWRKLRASSRPLLSPSEHTV